MPRPQYFTALGLGTAKIGGQVAQKASSQPHVFSSIGTNSKDQLSKPLETTWTKLGPSASNNRESRYWANEPSAVRTAPTNLKRIQLI